MKKKMRDIKYIGELLPDSDGFETLGARNIKEGTQLPSFLLAKERVDHPPIGGVVGVSKCAPCICANTARIVDSPGLCSARPPSLPQAVKRVKKTFLNLSFYRLLGAVSLIAVLLLNACSNPQQASKPADVKTSVKYTCPMHHQILEDHPGSCPICGMTLVKVTGQASEGSGISLNTVLQPVNSSVISNIAAITPEEKEIPTQIAGQGYIDFDSRTFNNIAARFSGRIEKLYIKYAFQEIHRGERIFDIYSPDMVSAQQDVIYLTKNSLNETSLISAAKQKLLLLGMTNKQVNQVIVSGKPFYSLPVYSPYDGHVHDSPHSQMSGTPEAKPEQSFSNNLPLSVKEGMYVEKGQTVFNIADPHHLWALIKIDRSAIAGLRLSQAVEISFPDIPGKTITGKVNFIEPQLEAGDKTTTVRVYLDNMDHSLKVNSVIKATIQTGVTDGLWIPRSALLDLGKTKIVWLKQGALFKVRKVSTGVINGNQIEVKSGLSATDSVASNAQYLTDSESFIKTKGDEQ